MGRHTVSCANAKRHECHCSGCTGALHRWQGCVAMARNAATRAEFRQRTDTEWNFASKPPPKRRRLKPTQREKAAATDSAVADIVDGLAGDPNAIGQIEDVAGKTSTAVADKLDQCFDAAHREQQRRNLAESHFWCGLLAEFAIALQEFNEEVDKVPGAVSAALAKATGTDSKISAAVVRLAVTTAWKGIKKIPLVDSVLGVVHLARLIQILAVMTCPAPENHRTVVKYCLDPLPREYVRDVTRERLKQALPDGWIH